MATGQFISNASAVLFTDSKAVLEDVHTMIERLKPLAQAHQERNEKELEQHEAWLKKPGTSLAGPPILLTHHIERLNRLLDIQLYLGMAKSEFWLTFDDLAVIYSEVIE